MRVVLLTQYYYPYTKSAAKLMHDLAVAMRREGADVTVVTPDENLPVRSAESVEEDVKVFRVRSRSFQVESAARRALNEMSMVYVTWRAGKRYFREHPADLLVWWAPSIFYTGLVRRLRSLWRCRTYLLLRDIIPKWWVDCGIMKEGSVVHRFFGLLERRQYAAADVVAIQSPANQRYFEEAGLAGTVNTEVLWNWTDISTPDMPRLDCRRELGLQGKTVFFYGGNIGIAQDMENILRLAESLREEEEIRFLLVGEGSDVPRLGAMIREKGLTNIQIRPPVDQKTYLGMLSEFDVGLISLNREHTTQNFPGKMLGYMLCMKPILASINPGNDLQPLLESHGAGLVSVNGERELLREQALRLAKNPALRRAMGRNGNRLLESVFSATTAARQILCHAGTGRGR